jgi:hypothetical protein
MSLEELMQEHIKALNANTRAIENYTKALTVEQKNIDVEHTKDSACKFCGVTYKTFQLYMEDGSIIPARRKNGRREYFKENDLVALCESKKLYSGEYGEMKQNPRSMYYGG